MGRFDTTAETYAAHREPYPPAFFAAAADALKLRGREALIDLGTGPGVLALGFAPYVQRILGVDPEPAMVAEARKAAEQARVTFPVLQGRAEDLGADVGLFDVVTIGRALHWMEREPTLAALERISAPGAHILICGSSSSKANPWRAAYDAVVHAWSGRRSEEHRRVHEHFFDGSRFARMADIRVEHTQDITAEALFERSLTRSTTSPAVLGDRLDAFKAELLAALTPFFADGAREELLEARAWVFAAGS
jgi:ubiquinone/menaquinone biosynthesis C-methylase UbiE